MTKKFNLWVSLGCRLDHKLFFYHPVYIKICLTIICLDDNERSKNNGIQGDVQNILVLLFLYILQVIRKIYR